MKRACLFQWGCIGGILLFLLLACPSKSRPGKDPISEAAEKKNQSLKISLSKAPPNSQSKAVSPAQVVAMIQQDPDPSALLKYLDLISYHFVKEIAKTPDKNKPILEFLSLKGFKTESERIEAAQAWITGVLQKPEDKGALKYTLLFVKENDKWKFDLIQSLILMKMAGHKPVEFEVLLKEAQKKAAAALQLKKEFHSAEKEKKEAFKEAPPKLDTVKRPTMVFE